MFKEGTKKRIIYPKAIVFFKFFSLHCYYYFRFLLITYQSGIWASFRFLSSAYCENIKVKIVKYTRIIWGSLYLDK